MQCSCATCTYQHFVDQGTFFEGEGQAKRLPDRLWTCNLSAYSVAPQAQASETAEVDPDEIRQVWEWEQMFKAMDLDDDGFITRRELVVSMRRDRKMADTLRFPIRVRSGDNSFDNFNQKFLIMNDDKLGHVSLKQFLAYMQNARPVLNRASAKFKGVVSMLSSPALSLTKS